jgi:hypothetical protein
MRGKCYRTKNSQVVTTWKLCTNYEKIYW